jgi:putative salt-induced outer membrane protein
MLDSIKSHVPAVLSLLAFGVVSGSARAEVASGTMKQDAATSGKTEVATETFEAAKKEDAPVDATEAKLQGGALLSTGNSRTLATTGSGSLRVRREANEIGAAAAVNYARSAAGAGRPLETSVENYQGKVRYDRFLTRDFALFVSLSGRRDRFQGLNLRMNLDPGVAYYFVNAPKAQLWGELGYDLQYDLRRSENIQAAAPMGTLLDRTDTRHSTRAFVGYRHALTEGVSLGTGLEYLQGIPETEYWRLNWDAGFTAAISQRFSLGTTFSLRYDNAPLPLIRKTDTQTAVNVVYQLH